MVDQWYTYGNEKAKRYLLRKKMIVLDDEENKSDKNKSDENK